MPKVPAVAGVKKRKAEDELTAAAAAAAPIVATKAPLPAGGGGDGDGDDDNDDNDDNDNDDEAARPGKQKKKEKSFLSKRAQLLAAAAKMLCPEHAQKLIRDANVPWGKRSGCVSVIFVLPRLFCAYNLLTL